MLRMASNEDFSLLFAFHVVLLLLCRLKLGRLLLHPSLVLGLVRRVRSVRIGLGRIIDIWLGE